MPGEKWTKSGDEWQELVVRILKTKFPDGKFVEIPDRVNGDGGIEGFTRDGTVYQCYASEELVDVAELTKRQKGKITTDLGKLQKNAVAFESILGITKIKRWVIVVPSWFDKSLVVHANKKAEEVIALGLSFIDPSFQISICTLEDYQEQISILGRNRKAFIDITPADISPVAVEEWIKTSDGDHLDNLSRKCRALQPNAALALQTRDAFIKQYLQGQNALEKLRSQHPDFFNDAVRLKRKMEAFLDSESLICDTQPAQKLRAALNEFECDLQALLPSLDKATIKHITFEAVIDWLVRCPLRFPASQ